MTSGGNNFKDFPENQLAKFRGLQLESGGGVRENFVVEFAWFTKVVLATSGGVRTPGPGPPASYAPVGDAFSTETSDSFQ